MTEIEGCEWCPDEVWYYVSLSSAGWPVTLKLCARCMSEAVAMSGHILDVRLTPARRRWLDSRIIEGKTPEV